jgi:hypothetical protein
MEYVQSINNMQLNQELIVRSLYEREYHKVSVEEASMEADYRDFMSIEIEENISISFKELSPKKNELSSLSPNSKFESSSQGSGGSF